MKLSLHGKMHIDTAHDFERTNQDEEVDDRPADLHLLWQNYDKRGNRPYAQKPPRVFIVHHKESMDS